jgi:hypothetical protein
LLWSDTFAADTYQDDWMQVKRPRDLAEVIPKPFCVTYRLNKYLLLLGGENTNPRNRLALKVCYFGFGGETAESRFTAVIRWLSFSPSILPPPLIAH